MEGLIDEEGRGIVLKESGVVCATSRRNLADLLGKIIVTMKDKNGIIIQEDYIIHVSPANAWWRDDYKWTSGQVSITVINGVAILKNVGQQEQDFGINYSGPFLRGRLGWAHIMDLCPWEPISSEKPQEGRLHSGEGNVIPDVSFSARKEGTKIYLRNLSSKTNVYGYVKSYHKGERKPESQCIKSQF
ncbi:hypothetical protein NXW84_15985 [Bacteroides fragilis]|nr:hypothetical protein NXW84_15985 [Bacteroides fragilis]